MNKEKQKQIASVKLVNGGMKGIEVEYLEPSVKGNVQFFDIYKSKRKAPVHEELEKAFVLTKSHLLDICGYTLEAEEREYLMNALSVTGAKYGEKGIILIGDLFVLGGTRVLKLETPLITDEVEYPDFANLKSIIDNIYSETKEYMDGKKVMSDMQIVARFNAKNEEFDYDSFTKMSKEEQREIATKILEEQGCMVFHNDEITTELEGITEEEKLPTAAEAFSFEEEQPPIVDDLSISASRKEDAHIVTLTHDDDDFALPLVKTEKKKSTAKKKVA